MEAPPDMEMASRPPLWKFVPIYISVFLYMSVGFLDISALPAYLEFVAMRDHPHASKDDIAILVATHMAACQLSLGISAVLVAGWAGRMSDKFGRRRCAALPALGQAVGMVLMAISTHMELDWRFVLASWATMGVFGGPFVFLAAAFAYIADWTRASGRGRAFASLDGLLLLFASLGPVIGNLLVSRLGFTGVWGACACAYVCAAIAFLLAAPSPQPTAKPWSEKPCAELLSTSTLALVGRMLQDRKQRALCLAFTLAMGGLNGGVACFILYAQRYLGWDTHRSYIGYYITAFSCAGAGFILLAHPLLSCLARRRVSDLAMVRGAYFGPVIYLLIISFVPHEHGTAAAFALIPLLAMGA
jgi:MFS family permease